MEGMLFIVGVMISMSILIKPKGRDYNRDLITIFHRDLTDIAFQLSRIADALNRK